MIATGLLLSERPRGCHLVEYSSSERQERLAIQAVNDYVTRVDPEPLLYAALDFLERYLPGLLPVCGLA